MKNKSIKEKLDIYADSLERKEEILYGAYRAMDLKRNSEVYDKKKNKFKKRFGLTGLIAAAVIFVVVIGVISSDLLKDMGTFPLRPYSLSSLEKQSVSREDFVVLTDVLFFTGETSQTDGRFFVYVNEKNEIYSAKAVYKVIKDGCVDEITIISDFKNKLNDYKTNKPTKDNSVIRIYDYYENGEYYSYLAALSDKTTYYIMITSPSKYAGEYYENILL